MPTPTPPSPGNTADSQQKPRWVKLTKEPLFQSRRAAAQLPLFQGELRLRARHETNFWYHLSPRLAGFCGLWFCPEDVWDVCFKLWGTWLSCNLLIVVPVRFLSKRQKIFVLTVNVIRRSSASSAVLPTWSIYIFFFCEKFEIHSAKEASAFNLKKSYCTFFLGSGRRCNALKPQQRGLFLESITRWLKLIPRPCCEQLPTAVGYAKRKSHRITCRSMTSTNCIFKLNPSLRLATHEAIIRC